MINYIDIYNEKIQKGDIIACKKIKKQYKKLSGMQKSGDYIFNLKEATRPIVFIETFCKHSKGEKAGQNVKLELFQKAFIQTVFGFFKKDGNRLFQEILLIVARKNGKSTLLSCLALYMLMADKEQGAEIYCVATKKDQAAIVFDETVRMWEQSSDLRNLLKKRRNDLYFPLTFSTLKALGKNADTLDGLNSHGVIIDELHGIKDRNLYEVMQQSQSARKRPLLIMITTAGTVRGSIFDDMYEYAKNILDGISKEESFLPLIYELDKEEEWTNEKYWIKANPGLNVIKNVSDLEKKVQRAKQDSKNLPGLLCKDFNIRQNEVTSWLDFSTIENFETDDLERYRGSYFIGGADLSKTNDLTCATILLYNKLTNRFFTVQKYFLPTEGIKEREQREKIPYTIWAKKDLLRLSEGNIVNYSDVTNWFVEMIKKYNLVPFQICYDSWSASYWVDEMEGYGFEMCPVHQGAKSLSLPMQYLESILKSKDLIYNNNPILKWCLSNTGVEVDTNENIKPCKLHRKMKIDGTASLLNCLYGFLNRQKEFTDL